MNTAEGLRRIATVIRWAGCFVGALFGLAAFDAFRQGQQNFVIAYAVLSVLAGGGGLGLGWIVDGFAKPKV